MAQLTVRKLDPELVRRLKIRAAEHNRSMEAELRVILETTLRPEKQAFLERAARLRESLRGRQQTDSTLLIREARDRDLPPER